MKAHTVVLKPTDPDRNLTMKLVIAAPDQKTAEAKALAYVEREFAPLKYKLAK